MNTKLGGTALSIGLQALVQNTTSCCFAKVEGIFFFITQENHLHVRVVSD